MDIAFFNSLLVTAATDASTTSFQLLRQAEQPDKNHLKNIEQNIESQKVCVYNCLLRFILVDDKCVRNLKSEGGH
jgi:hypothetical protein